MALQVISKRRARFRRATSGSQNLTMLIYNILKEQIAAKKSAILTAFEANMSARNYNSTYGGNAVDRETVEALYREMIAAFPAGTTEHDKMVAELNKFHSDAIYAEMKAYRDAYESGTEAFGKKIELTDYLAFLRDAKSSTGNSADYQEYNVEEFIVTFNDVNTDMKAAGASAGAMAKFYRRELSRAEGMGITKDSESYRKIQLYLRDAEKQAAADYKNDLYKNSVNDINKYSAKISNGLIDSMKAAVQRGYITYSDLIQITGDKVTDTFKNFMSLDQSIQAKILEAGISSGVKVDGELFNSTYIFTQVESMRDSLKKASESTVGGPDFQAQMLSLLNMVDDAYGEPLGLLTDIEKASKASRQFIIDQGHVFGNPVSKADLYARHANTLDTLGVSEIQGKAMKDLFRGLIPNGGEGFVYEDGKQKKFLWELNGDEVNRLVEEYTGVTYVLMPGISPKDVIADVVSEYRAKNDVETGKSFLQWQIIPGTENTPNPTIEVVATSSPVTGGMPTISGPKLTDNMDVAISGSQIPQNVYNMDKTKVIGQRFFEIGDNGAPVFKYLVDNKVMDWDAFERYCNDMGAKVATDTNGDIIVGSTLDTQFNAEAISGNPDYSSFISKGYFNGIAKGPGYDKALKKIGEEVASNLLASGGSSSVFSVDQATGKISVVSSEAARALTGHDKQYMETILNAAGPEFTSLDPNFAPRPQPNAAAQAVGVALFKASERDYYAQTAGTSPSAAELSKLREMGASAASKAKGSEMSDLYGKSPILTNPFGGLGFIPSSNQLGLSQADAARLSGLESQRAQFDASANYQKAVRAAELGKSMTTQTEYAPYAKKQSSISGGADYFFRNASPTSTDTGSSGYSSYSFTPSAIGSGATYSPTSVPKFTPAEIDKSLIDFRAGERV